MAARTSRWILAAVVIAAAGVVALLVLGDGSSPAPAPPAAAPAPREAIPAAAPVPASAPGASPADAGPAAPSGPPEWKDVRLSARFSDLGPALARDVYDGLQRAREAMSGCFAAAAEDVRGPAAPAQPDEMGPPIVTLQLESGQGELVIVAAPLQQLGSGTTKLVDCCEAVLRGYRIPARNAVPGKRYRLQHALM